MNRGQLKANMRSEPAVGVPPEFDPEEYAYWRAIYGREGRKRERRGPHSMNHLDEELRKAIALFRYGLVADVLRLPPGSREILRTLHEKAQRTYPIPGTCRTRVAMETMRDWRSLYRNGGCEALYPKTRADRGRPRRLARSGVRCSGWTGIATLCSHGG